MCTVVHLACFELHPRTWKLRFTHPGSRTVWRVAQSMLVHRSSAAAGMSADGPRLASACPSADTLAPTVGCDAYCTGAALEAIREAERTSDS
eukprot:6207688-Pleurochrysis_carterae.AAC.2